MMRAIAMRVLLLLVSLEGGVLLLCNVFYPDSSLQQFLLQMMLFTVLALPLVTLFVLTVDFLCARKKGTAAVSLLLFFLLLVLLIASRTTL